jgi:hypothetical protein
MLCGRLREVIVRVREIPISGKLRGDYDNDACYRAWFQDWLNRLWLEKDARIAAILSHAGKRDDRPAKDPLRRAA